MIKGKFFFTVFLVFAPNIEHPRFLRSYSRFTEAFSASLSEFCDCGFQIFRAELVSRSFPSKDGENDG